MILPSYEMISETLRLRCKAEGIDFELPKPFRQNYNLVIEAADPSLPHLEVISQAIAEFEEQKLLGKDQAVFNQAFLDLCLMLNGYQIFGGAMEIARMMAPGSISLRTKPCKGITRDRSLALWLNEVTFRANSFKLASYLRKA